MQIEDINDEDSLRAWLLEQDIREVSVAIAARAALRVQPWLWARLAPARPDAEWTALPFVWSTITSAVAAVSPTADVKNATRATRAATRATLAATDAALAATDAALAGTRADTDATHAALAATDAALLATDAALAATDAARATADAALAARAATRAATRATAAAFWAEVSRDAQLLLKGEDVVWGLPLWQRPPERSAEDWAKTRAAWQTGGAPWDGFARIYDNFWEGREHDWAYLEQIVLIDPKVWQAGPDAMADALAKIDVARANQDGRTELRANGISLAEVEAVEAQTDIGEAISVNPETMQLISVPDKDLDQYAFEDILDRLDSALENLPSQASQANEYLAVHEAAKRLQRVLQKRRDRPVRIFQVSLEVVQLIEGHAAAGSCPPIESDPILRAFCRELYAAAASLQAHDTHVRRFNNPVLQERLKEVSDDQARSLAQPVAQIVEVAEGALAEDGKEAVALLEDLEVDPVARRNAVARAASWITRSFGLILRSNTSQTIQLGAAIYALEPILAPFVKWFLALLL